MKHSTLTYRPFCLLICCFLFNFSPVFGWQYTDPAVQSLHAELLGKTVPLSQVLPLAVAQRIGTEVYEKADEVERIDFDYVRPEEPIGFEDSLWTKNLDTLPVLPVTPRLTFEGLKESDGVDYYRPDVNGDVGIDHYIQIINASVFAIFDKKGGSITSPVSTSTLWNQINKIPIGDPVIQYDEMADRWIIMELSFQYEILIGITSTADPMGAWNLYSVPTHKNGDYPKIGIGPKTYAITILDATGLNPVYLLNRAQMLEGADEIDVQIVTIPAIAAFVPTITPVDLDGDIQPPSDEVFLIRMKDVANTSNNTDMVEIWSIVPDWLIPSHTTINVHSMAVAPFVISACPQIPSDPACIPQPGTAAHLLNLAGLIMNKAVYRNFESHESIVFTFSSIISGYISGVRWTELRRLPGADWMVYQEGVVASNEEHRFMSSISINAKGSIGLGYAVSGPSTYPSLRFTGRLAGDPLGAMTVPEYEFAAGSGVRSQSAYGDYFSLTVDPVDDSFWFTGEYVVGDGSFSTKITNFQLSKDSFDLAVTALEAPKNSTTLTDTETVTIKVKNVGSRPVTHFSIGYVLDDNPVIKELAAMDTLAPDSVYVHTFSVKADMHLLKKYFFKVFTASNDDTCSGNDTLRFERAKKAMFDATTIQIDGLDNAVCLDSTNAWVTIANYGEASINTFSILYTLNGIDLPPKNWMGSLPPGATFNDTISLGNLGAGWNSLTIKIMNPNGFTDEIPENDTISKYFMVIKDGVPIHFSLLTDAFPEETSWVLTDNQGDKLFSGGNYDQAFTLYTETWCLPSNLCYTFAINDYFGDGLGVLGQNQGNYTITDDNGLVLASTINANFGNKELFDFCVNADCAVTATALVTNTSTYVSNDGAILINASAGMLPFGYSIDNGQHYQQDSLFQGLSKGIYLIVVRDAMGCTFHFTVVIQFATDTREPGTEMQLIVSPNPSLEGNFLIIGDGWPTTSATIQTEVVDVMGKPVFFQRFSGGSHDFSAEISLSTSPPGVYFLRLKSGDMYAVKKIVKIGDR